MTSKVTLVSNIDSSSALDLHCIGLDPNQFQSVFCQRAGYTYTVCAFAITSETIETIIKWQSEFTTEQKKC